MPDSLRISWLIQGDESFGVKRAILNLMFGLCKAGHHPAAISLSPGPFADTLAACGIPVTQLSSGPISGLSGSIAAKAIQYVRILRQTKLKAQAVANALRDSRTDLLHFLWPNYVCLAGHAAKMAGIPAVWEMPNYVSDRYPFNLNRRILQRQLHHFSILPLANSNYTAGTLGAHPVQPAIFHLGANDEIFNPAHVTGVSRQSLGVPSSAIVFTIVARLEKLKGQDRFLDALCRVPDSANWYMLLLGGPTGSPYAQALLRTGGDRIRLVGNVSNPEAYYALTDVAVNSRVDAEPFGLSVIEAMLMAKPVIVHALGGPAETVRDGIDGWHVDNPSIERFTAGLRRAIGDRPRWPAMGLSARQHALSNFTTAHQTERYLQLLSRHVPSVSGGQVTVR